MLKLSAKNVKLHGKDGSYNNIQFKILWASCRLIYGYTQ